ncbi:nucleotidyltransferase family protein [Simiduia curdlanivorans]|uniref:Nucleotidyltransferase family protein n=1 Tax=Simiduia curdlanivorans TaxID=1492769 RepID=A0ABV8V4E7_9GAMM|nr:nucleotidyltransferase family protein [Simiduia curdlanivorans]MDN3640273.1 nucleotidyltransferase family protein [Simiduia curdlanivorans]
MTLSVLVLAAGQGRRFGAEPKQLAQYQGAPLLAHSLTLAETLAPGRVLLLLGAHAETIVSRMPQLQRVNYRVHPHWAKGIGASIAFAVQHLPTDAEAVLILLADQIAVSDADLEHLWLRYTKQRETSGAIAGSGQEKIVCAHYAGQLGVPAIFPRRYFPRLAALQGDKGAKKILLTEPVVSVSLPNAAIDIDTPEDLHHVTERKEPSCLN